MPLESWDKHAQVVPTVPTALFAPLMSAAETTHSCKRFFFIFVRKTFARTTTTCWAKEEEKHNGSSLQPFFPLPMLRWGV